MTAVEGPFGFAVADDEAAWGCHIVGSKIVEGEREGEGAQGIECSMLSGGGTEGQEALLVSTTSRGAAMSSQSCLPACHSLHWRSRTAVPEAETAIMQVCCRMRRKA